MRRKNNCRFWTWPVVVTLAILVWLGTLIYQIQTEFDGHDVHSCVKPAAEHLRRLRRAERHDKAKQRFLRKLREINYQYQAELN